MTGPCEAPPFDLDRIRDVAHAGSTRFWSSLEELLDEDAFRKWLSAEFPAAASIFDDPARRQFLKLMGASLLLGSLTACGEDRSGKALPYVNQPEATVPGVPRYYATALPFEGYVQPVLATTYSGRPTKLDGNPDHPVTRGASDIFMQSAIFELYDPDRSKTPLRDRSPVTWEAFAREMASLRTHWRERQGEGLRILTGSTSSPTFTRQMADLAKQFPKMRWHRFEPVGTACQDDAMRIAFHRAVVPHFNFDQCDVIVSIGHDFAGEGPHQVRFASAWAKKRGDSAPARGRSRLHVAECVPSLTGTVASMRLPCDVSRLGRLVQAIAAEFELAGWNMPELRPDEKKWLDLALNELRSANGRSLLLIGPHLDPSWQALAPLINAQLGNTGVTVWYSDPILRPVEDGQTLATLAADISSGLVETLVMIDCNPAYTAPGVLDFPKLMSRIPNLIHAGLYANETGQAGGWHLPLSHPLECWSDGHAVDGSISIVQPVIAPLYSTRSSHQMLDLLLGVGDANADAAVRATWQANFGEAFAERWPQTLHDGFVAGSAALPRDVKPAPPPPPTDEAGNSDEIEIVFLPDPTIRDGRYANIAWLQELPKPLTKITWDSAILLSPAFAAASGVSNGDMIEITVGDRRLEGAAWINPGQAKTTVALFLGYGRRAGGDIATDSGGYDAYSLQPTANAFSARGKVRRLGPTYRIATTQSHHRMENFDFVREVTADQPETPRPKESTTLYPDWDGGNHPPEHAWGMVIDEDLCTGCNACISACNVENNVLVVGKDQVAKGREMMWLRVDRYYTGDIENPRSFFQPVPCMHCEKAPCEMGCPVNATSHSPDGINQMVYNRCIGTRTCSSYCPYKVRRFNWFDYRQTAEAEQAAKNPDVTVRSRGVMEKCTYCTQRIQSAQIQADKENRKLHRDEVVTACQQACPTKAIVFGDLKDGGSAVAQRRQNGRHYALLEELGTRPRTTYLARWNDSSAKGGKA